MSDVLWTIAAMFAMYIIGGLTGAMVYRMFDKRTHDILGDGGK